MIVAPGQGHDGQMLPDLLDEIRVPRLGPGRPRTTPDKVLGDKAYSSRATRTLLRTRGIVAVIPEPADQRANRIRRGSIGDAGLLVGEEVIGLPVGAFVTVGFTAPSPPPQAAVAKPVKVNAAAIRIRFVNA